VGSTVVLTGTNFDKVTSVSLGLVNASYTLVSPTRIDAVVPAGAAGLGTVRWRVHWAGEAVLHGTPFVVTTPMPTLASYSPGSGPVGVTVTLTGTSLDLVTQVTLGLVDAAFTIVSPTRIDAVVPAGAAGLGTVRWRVHWSGGVVLHDTPFVVT
jgi:hypothetical protein